MKAANEIVRAPMTMSWTSLADYLELTKPRVTTLILMSTFIGFYLAVPRGSTLDFWLLLHTLLGTGLLAGGAAALNMYWERDVDAKMLRTHRRPLPAGRLAPNQALWFGVGMTVLGSLYLGWWVNLLTGILGLATTLCYLAGYTPLKRKSSLCTFVGAFPGAMPIVLGWTAVRNSVGIEAFVLFLILFFWQFPHFLSIAWMYREDYARGNIKMLPVVEPSGQATARQIIFYSLALIPVSLVPTLLHLTGQLYLLGALALGGAFFYMGAELARTKKTWQARRVLLASVFYLPLLYGLMLLNRVT